LKSRKTFSDKAAVYIIKENILAGGHAFDRRIPQLFKEKR